MSQTNSGVRWTIQDVEALPDNEWIRYEIIDGELFVTRSPHHKHQHVTGRIFAVYSVQGVQEYWIVDRISQRVEVYRL